MKHDKVNWLALLELFTVTMTPWLHVHAVFVIVAVAASFIRSGGVPCHAVAEE